MKVKVCGITNIKDARLSQSLGADFLGFIFAKQSKRHVEISKAKEIIEELKLNNAIGVFVEQDTDEMAEIAKELNLFAVQYYHQQPKPVANVKNIFSIRVKDQQSFDIMSNKDIDYFIVESDFSLENYQDKGIVKRENDFAIMPNKLDSVFLAGGLDCDNVLNACKHKPFAIDVCSGVEASPGVKDPQKLQDFISKVKNYD